MKMNDLKIVKGKKVFVATKMQDNQSISFSDSTKILSNLAGLNGEVILSSKRGYHSMLSVVGNGRFRDRGISSRLIAEILKSKRLTQQLNIKFKVMMEHSALEPVISTGSLQNLITALKTNIHISKNGLDGYFEYKGVKIELTPSEVYSLKHSL